jgi:hypothetical protein
MSLFVLDAWDKISEQKEFYENPNQQPRSPIILLVVMLIALLLFASYTAVAGYAVIDAVSSGSSILGKMLNLIGALFFTPIYLAVRVYQLKKLNP